jgi:hypothetical protein
MMVVVMKNRTGWLNGLLAVTVLVFGLAGFAAVDKSHAADTETQLAAAGFKMRLADTPAKLAHLKTLTQLKVVPHERNGKTYYIYADATYCKCLYAGNQKAYQLYQKLAVQKQNIERMNEDAEMDWEMWGPWDPGW